MYYDLTLAKCSQLLSILSLSGITWMFNLFPIELSAVLTRICLEDVPDLDAYQPTICIITIRLVEVYLV